MKVSFYFIQSNKSFNINDFENMEFGNMIFLNIGNYGRCVAAFGEIEIVRVKASVQSYDFAIIVLVTSVNNNKPIPIPYNCRKKCNEKRELLLKIIY